MADKRLFDEVSFRSSELITKSYSTSFSLGIRFLNPKFREAIYNIYGFVRLADEIVDTFHAFDKETLLWEFRKDTFKAIAQGISLNPVLNSFQKTINQYGIDPELINSFLDSMEMDLNKQKHDQISYQNYIFGSAEVVGLMCLRVFTEGDVELYNRLYEPAMRLGSAFQKINFLRDLKEDNLGLDRMYFPNLSFGRFDLKAKHEIEADIQLDFQAGYEGILKLPKTSRFGVYLAYIYYKALFNKIKGISPQRVVEERIRIPGFRKFFLLFNSYLRHNFNLL